MKSLIDVWLRRGWRRDDEALARLAGAHPAVVVTGGSEGIGFELARSFAPSGDAVLLVARDRERLEAAAARLGEETGRRFLTLALDVTEPDAPERIAASLAETGHYVDVLINSAAIGASGDFAGEDPATLRRLTELNITAQDALIRAFLPAMLLRGGGGVVNVSSLGGFGAGPYQAAYYASKSYVIALTRALAHETRGKGVRIATVAPGPVNTQFHARMDAEGSLYRYVLPALSAAQVARSAKRGYDWGHTLIVPGVFNNVLALALRVLPGMFTTPIVAILLKPRFGTADVRQQQRRD